MKLQLLSKGYTNAKLRKSVTESYILYMAPSDSVAGINVCPAASPGCRKACLFTAGRGAMQSVIDARKRKTEWYRDNYKGFISQLIAELQWLNMRGTKIAVRLNGTSDIDWETMFNMEQFENIQFYDYTKRFVRAVNSWGTVWPKNYHLTFSRSEVTRDSIMLRLLSNGINVAVVFRGDSLPDTWMGYRVIDGDASDERFNDPKGVIVGLLQKGKAKQDDSGFVVAA